MNMAKVKGSASHVWAECPCGKIVQRATFRLGTTHDTRCQECMPPRGTDRCGEQVRSPAWRGTRRCVLTRRHKGRCE